MKAVYTYKKTQEVMLIGSPRWEELKRQYIESFKTEILLESHTRTSLNNKLDYLYSKFKRELFI